MQTALITGITGQTGSFLARYLLNRGYQVTGVINPATDPAVHGHLQALHAWDQVNLVPIELTDAAAVRAVLEAVQPAHVYHLAAQASEVRAFAQPLVAADITGLSTAYLLEGCRLTCPEARFVFASSCGIFGAVEEQPQTERTRLAPRTPYGCAKAYGHFLTQSYRESFGTHASCAILYNHESPLRPVEFVTRKISRGVARIKAGLDQELVLGNTSVVRDWGFAGDYVEALHRIACHESAGDYIVATGEAHTLAQFLDMAFGAADLKASDYVRSDPGHFRNADKQSLVGDASRAHQILGWAPRVSLPQLVEMMVRYDTDLLNTGHAEIPAPFGTAL